MKLDLIVISANRLCRNCHCEPACRQAPSSVQTGNIVNKMDRDIGNSKKYPAI